MVGLVFQGLAVVLFLYVVGCMSLAESERRGEGTSTHFERLLAGVLVTLVIGIVVSSIIMALWFILLLWSLLP